MSNTISSWPTGHRASLNAPCGSCMASGCNGWKKTSKQPSASWYRSWGAGAAWDIHHRASETLAEYLRLADDVESQRVQKLVADARSRGEPESLAWWRNWITTDRSMLPRHPSPEKRADMDLPRELVVALVGAGLMWGGQYRTAKDIMHFDLREGPIKHRPKGMSSSI